MTDHIARLRREYSQHGLDESNVGDDPIAFFQRWFEDALGSDELEPNAMTVATVGADGQPSARIMLLKGASERGFVFFTNYRSRKADQITENPRVALCLWWACLERQVRVEGPVEKMPPKESDAYFATRPEGSKLGAWASPQSSVIESREVLDQRLQDLRVEIAGRGIPRPPEWGGYLLSPRLIEFWQGRPSRLHDRFRFTRHGDSPWLRERLAP